MNRIQPEIRLMRIVFVRSLTAIAILSLLGFSGGKEDTPSSLESAGNDGSLIWAKHTGDSVWSGSGGLFPDPYDRGYGITMLSDDSVVVTGSFSEQATFGKGEANETVVSSCQNDIFVARYNPDGTLAWVKSTWSISFYNKGSGITTLSDDSTVVTGHFSNSVKFGEGEPNETILRTGASYDDRDIFVARYNADGTLAWVKSAGGTDYDYGRGITTLSDDSTVVTGSFYGSATFGEGEANETVLVSDGSDDIFVARYNPDGTLAWAKSAGGTDYDGGNGITTLSDDSTVVTGYFEGSLPFGNVEPNETVPESNGTPEIFMARYNPDGTLEWAKRSSGMGGGQGRGITTLADDSTVVAGYFWDTTAFGAGEANETVLVSGGSMDIYVARYNPDGTLAWVKSAGGGMFYDRGSGITTLSDDSTVVTGRFWSTATFGEGEPNETVLASDGKSDIFVARYNPDGTLEWIKSAGGTDYDNGNGITTLSDDSTVVTGWHNKSAVFGEGEANETVLVSDRYDDIFVARFAP